ncbi:restriction endonuclease subunit S [Bacteroides thetaiotaomicron]|jgi:type I restriction enzyme S subunit|uniref:restriction endonuclease subunit S n=1 Tax=Bacteroides thetaiotaomicron TaxID=818 RepID=UPI0021650871|nr:restriction endonuclease subunit S [Bacteroides thetaiotaomicron]MCS3329577.1 restriction endonuclease subunit S [Bacteroides thetaiotaomicron]
MKIKDIVRFHSETTMPIPDVVYHLYSLPSFDNNQTREELLGQDIQSNKFTVPNRCILFNKLNVRFKRIWRIDSDEDHKIASTEFLPLIIDENKVDFDYCFYLLASPVITDYLCGQNANTSGSHKRIDPTNFFNIGIKLPPLAQQYEIGKLLSSLDAKIKLNRQINQNLEAMAKQLYDYWFVQFDFPNKDGKPYKSSGGEMVWNEKLKRMIPKEWTNANIYQLASISKETVNPQAQPNELFKHYSLPEYDKTGTYAEEYGIDIQSAKFIVTNNCILVSKLNPWTSRVICGNRGSNQICSTEFVVWNPASLKTKGFLFMLAKSAKFIEYCTQGATGTSHSHRRINPELMMKFDFPYNSEIAIKFSLLIENIIVHLHNNIAQLKVLTKQRDELLPLLMNGQITIE